MKNAKGWEEAYIKAGGGAKYLFKVRWDSAGRGYPAPGEEASCCSEIRAPSRSFPYSLVSHLRTIRHFRIWCLEHPFEVRERFPSAVDLVAEAILTNEEAQS